MKETDLNKLIVQLPKLFIFLGEFNSHNVIWRFKNSCKKEKILEDVINNELCLLRDKSNTYLHPVSGTHSAIELSLFHSSICIYNWQVLFYYTEDFRTN